MKVIYVKDKFNTSNNSFLGKSSISKLHSIVLSYFNKEDEIVLDFTGLSVRPNLILDIAELSYTYKIKITGLNDKTETVQNIVDSGYFQKKELGIEYANQLVSLISTLNFPYMILDTNIWTKDIYLIKPYKIQHNYLYYRKLNPSFVQPRKMVEGYLNNESIWTNDSIFIPDISLKESTIRFPTNPKERGIIDIVEMIVSKYDSKYLGEV